MPAAQEAQQHPLHLLQLTALLHGSRPTGAYSDPWFRGQGKVTRGQLRTEHGQAGGIQLQGDDHW